MKHVGVNGVVRAPSSGFAVLAWNAGVMLDSPRTIEIRARRVCALAASPSGRLDTTNARDKTSPCCLRETTNHGRRVRQLSGPRQRSHP